MPLALRDVPVLGGYLGLCVLNNPMAGTISRRNCVRFEDILYALRATERLLTNTRQMRGGGSSQ